MSRQQDLAELDHLVFDSETGETVGAFQTHDMAQLFKIKLDAILYFDATASIYEIRAVGA